jgi:hypothetical protein
MKTAPRYLPIILTVLLASWTGFTWAQPACPDCPPESEPAETEEKEKTAPAETPQGPPEDAVEFQGHFYKVFDLDDTEVTWHAKKELCEKMGGQLAVIETEEEQKFIAELADDRYLSLGATDEEEEGTWKWINGAEWTGFGWMEDQPNNYGGDENYLATYDYGEWVDVAVGGYDYWLPTGYICEWEPQEAPQED